MNKIKKIIENGYNLDGNEIYNDTFKIYQKMVVPAGAILFLLLAILMIIYSVCLFSFFNSLEEIEAFASTFNILNLSTEMFIYYILITSSINGITTIFSAGFIKMARDVYFGELPKFGSVFSFFVKKEGLKIFIFSLFVQILYSVISLILESIGLQLVSIFIYILISLLTLLVIPFIIFDKMSIVKALSASVSIINQKPFKIMSYMILLGVLSVSGIFIFFIGIIFTLPIFYCFNYSIYQNIINKN